ncbi:GH25 family lysozyme [Limosilactobacillus mucosae]|uniref:GH25 family lysozyme n=1 Tax=Limosilactobacillus mucosae TaxID=97478 RepID=A0AAJ1MAR1_LIMMU|nr:GH25 family lysozyme [Limosilactobacillus mucosae]MDC2828943.1 GH25 family lysozyme [Limosilactobacillus mucosae]
MRRKHYETLAVLGILSSAVVSNSATVHADVNSSQVEAKTDSQDTQNQSSDDEATLNFHTSTSQEQGQDSNTDTTSPDSNDSTDSNDNTVIKAPDNDNGVTDQTSNTEDNNAQESNGTDYSYSAVNSLLASSLIQSTTATTTPASDSYIPAKSYGVDVSGYQDTDLTKYAQANAKYAIVKLSEGTWYTNPNAQGQLNSANKLGMATYAYHFANFSDNATEAEKEAAFAIQQAQKVGLKTGSYLAIDWETEGNVNVVTGDTEKNTAAVMAFMKKVQQAGYLPLVYTGAYNFQDHLNVSEINKQFPNSLWVASYKTTGEIDEPDFNYFPSLQGVAIWQFTSNWKGLSVDANVNVLPLINNASTSSSSSPTTPSTVTTTYQVIDDDDNGSVVTKGSFTGKSNSSITNQAIIDNNAANLLDKYVLASPADSNLLTNNSGTITIHVNHKKETVNETHETTVKVMEDLSTPGNLSPASGISKKYTFTRTGTKDLATGKTTWGKWSSPETLRVDRYTFMITGESPNANITITNKGVLINTDAAPHKVTNTLNFVDAAGKTVKTASVSADDQNKPMDISNLIPDGYQLVDSANASLTSGENGSFFNVEIKKTSADSTDPTPISPDHPGDSHDSDSGQSDQSNPTPVTPGDSDTADKGTSGNDSTPTDPENPNNPNDSNTPIIVNTIEFIDDQGKMVGSINVKVNAAGQKIILNSDSIPAGYKLVDSTSLVLTAKDNGATIQVKVAADANTDDNSGQNTPAPITPGDSGTADKGTSDTSSSSDTQSQSNQSDTDTESQGKPSNPDNAKDTSNGATGTSSTIPSWDSVNSNGSAVIDSGMANILGSGIAGSDSDDNNNGLSSQNHSDSASSTSFAPGTAVSVESGDAAPASSDSVLPQTGNSANAQKAKTVGIMMLLTELFASMGLIQKRNKKQQIN